MKALLVDLRNELDAKGIHRKVVAAHWGVEPSVVTKVLSGRRQISLKFLIKLLLLLQKSADMIKIAVLKYVEYAKHQRLREAMEYSALSGDFETLKLIVDREKESKRTENRDYAKVYDLIHMWYTTDIKPKNYNKEVLKVSRQVKDLDMEILTEILSCQTIYQSGDYNALHERLLDVEEKISARKSKSVKATFALRMQEAIAITSLEKGLVEETRKACLEIIESLEGEQAFSIVKANAYLKLGESYIFEEDKYEVAKTYLEKTLEIIKQSPECKRLNRKVWLVQNTLSFLKIYHLRDLDTLGKLHPAEAAFLKVRLGDHKAAERLLLKLEKRNKSLSGMQTVYLGLARSDKSLVKRGLELMELSGSIFYAQLAKKHLGLFI